MKVLFQDYTFKPDTNQIVFNTTENISLEQILVITNVTDNIIIYNFADPAKGGVLSNNVLTLTFDTTSMFDADSLQIFLEVQINPSTDESVVLLRRLIQLLTPIGVQDANQRQRVSLDAAPASISVLSATASNFNTNTALVGSVDARFPIIDQARNTFANGIRQNLTY
jgi:hypothetical protein